MKTLIATLQLSDSTSGHTRERCPDIVFALNGEIIAAIRTDTERPRLPLDDDDVEAIEIRDDALSRAIDEPTWMAEIARVLAANGTLQLTLPSSGPLAWLDTMNMYRYAVDIGKRGDQPDAALPTGWNRHHPRKGVISLLSDAGFYDIKIRPANYADREIKLFAIMIWNNWIRGERYTERDHWPKLGARTPAERLCPIGTTWSISARKLR